MFFSNLLAGSNVGSSVLLISLIGVIVLFMVLNGRSTKKRQQEQQRILDAIRPGNKVKTIGGVCGVVVEVCAEDHSFILETGSEEFGKSYIKFDKQSVYQTDAVVEKEEVKPAPADEEVADAPEVDNAEKNEETPTEE
jgi:preprotein translocase YajC subunit